VFYLCTPAGFIWLVVVVEDTMAHRQAIRGEGGGGCAGVSLQDNM